MRLIDADALLRRYDETHVGEPGNAIKLIEEAPTITFADLVDQRAREMERKKLERWLEDHQNEQR